MSGEYDVRLTNLENHVNTLSIQMGSMQSSVMDQGKRIEKVLDLLTKEKPGMNWGWIAAGLGLLGMVITLYTQPIIQINARQTDRIDTLSEDLHHLTTEVVEIDVKLDDLSRRVELIDTEGSRKWIGQVPHAEEK